MTILKTIIFGDVPSYFQTLQNSSVWLAPVDDQLRNQSRKTFHVQRGRRLANIRTETSKQQLSDECWLVRMLLGYGIQQQEIESSLKVLDMESNSKKVGKAINDVCW